MKRTSLLSMPFAALLVLCAATAAPAMYHPTLGRFVQRDPIEYVDGMSQYEYVGSMPLGSRDALGMMKGFNYNPFSGTYTPPGAEPEPLYTLEAVAIDAMAALSRAMGQHNLPPQRSGSEFATSFDYCCTCVPIAKSNQDVELRYAQSHRESARLGQNSEQSRQWRQEQGWRTAASTSLTRVWIEPPSGPCADLIFQGRGEHERVHWEERNRIMDDARRGLSRATTVWGQTRNDPQLRAAEEIRATEAARKFYQEFIDACGNLFGVGRPSVAI